MFVRYQKQGIVVLSWHDIRDAKKAQAILISGLFFGAKESLVAAFITPSNLIKVTIFILHTGRLLIIMKATGESPFVNGREGNLSITADQQPNSNGQQPVSLHAALALFGELSSFVVNPGNNSVSLTVLTHDETLLGTPCGILDYLPRLLLRCTRSDKCRKGTKRPLYIRHAGPCCRRTSSRCNLHTRIFSSH